jgi:hypothetical protein
MTKRLNIICYIDGLVSNGRFNNRDNLLIQLHYLFLGVPLNQNCILHFMTSSISLKACSKGIV